MICPECGGRGEVTRRFLVFFTVRRPCPRCTPRLRDDDWPDDSWRRTADPLPLSALSLPMGQDRDQFEVGSGGRSGGTGADASWADEAPLIVDPFHADASLPAERDAGSDFSGAESESASADDTTSGSDSGTSY